MLPIVKLQTHKTLEVAKQIKIGFQFTRSCVWPLQIVLVVVVVIVLKHLQQDVLKKWQQ